MGKPTYSQGMFCWNELGTTDAGAARDFYVSLIGWSTAAQALPNDMGTYILCNLKDESVAGLYQMKGPQFQGVPSHWLSYVWVDDVDASAKKVRDLGGKLIANPMDVPGVGRIAVAADPCGAHFGLFRGREHPGAAQFEGNPSGSFCWNECMTSDPAKARAFYCGLLGWTAAERDMGPMKYTMFLKGDRPCGGMMAIDANMAKMGVPPHWLAYVTVADCDAKAREAEKLGARVLCPPTDVPTVGRFAVLQDPTGAAIAIIKLDPPAAKP